MDSCFDKVDADKSGYIEEKELETLLKKVTELFKFKKIEVTEEQINNALKIMDTDSDGKISKEEFRKTSRTKLLAIVNDDSS
jgi:Ca2+-binding EF-hand superfamily protein